MYRLSAILVLCLALNTHAQQKDFGDISMNELVATFLPQDTSANAYVIFDVGAMFINPDYELEMERHIRIKILSEEGKSWADVSIPFYHKDLISNIEAASYTPEGEEFELDPDNIYEEGSKNWRKKVFAIPGVETGSVIEYKYRLTSKYIGALEPWFFQSSIFTKYSAVSFYLPKYFTFTANSNVINLKNSKAKVLNRYNPQDTKHTRYTWEMNDLPAIRKEPFMYNQQDYYAKLFFQIQTYKSPYTFLNFAKTWKDVTKQIIKSLRSKLDDEDTRETVEKVTANAATDLEKARALYFFVLRDIHIRDYVHWNASKLLSPMEVLEKKEGSRNEKNLLLINLLRRAGITADPFLISSRSHGRPSGNWISTQQFDYLIVATTIKGKLYYLDSGTRGNPFGGIPYFLYTGQGLQVTKNGKLLAAFNKYKPLRQKNSIVIDSHGRLNDESGISVRTEATYNGQDAFRMRNKLFKAKSEKDFIENFVQEKYDQAVIDTFSIQNRDDLEKPLILTVEFSLEDYVENSGALSFIEPVFLSGTTKNPFLSEKRTFPVDFYYGTKTKESFVLLLPAGLKADELPERVSARLKGFLYSRTVSLLENNKIEFRRSLLRKNTHFIPEVYPKLRRAYNTMLEGDHTQVVLQQ